MGAEETRVTFKLALLAPSGPVPRFSQLHVKTLRDLGYVEDRNLLFIERWAARSEERLHRDAAELVELKVDVILAGTSTGVRAAATATKTIPIVAAGFTLGDVARLNYYTTNVDSFLTAYEVAASHLAKAGCQPSSTLLGVTRLAFPELLIEIEATAVK